ncbi:MAG: hypothetical protein KF799_09260 [Bdellovibrionales bacterium]|nr:hypothetical protein [Bdellovibrionales bacterium]
MSELLSNPKLQWMSGEYLRPYVYVRNENRIPDPGKKFSVDWFPIQPMFKNPLAMDEVDFADQILRLESRAFAATNMPMPRWVFYDCAIMPGFVAGYAIHRSKASKEMLDLLQPMATTEWLPISLFIIIPTMAPKEWVAHNLCSVNSLLPAEQSIYGLGFLTKAFGLWYANVEVLCGVTQWASPAVRLHTHYGDFEVLTAYTPVHSYARTLTYRMVTDSKEWKRFFSREQAPDFTAKYQDAGFQVDPKNDESLKAFQRKLEAGGVRYYLNATQIRTEPLDSALQVYKRTSNKG